MQYHRRAAPKFVLGLCFTAAGVAFALAACGGDSNVVDPAPDSGTSSTSSSSSSGSSGGSSSGSTSSSSGDNPSPDSGEPAPKKVSFIAIGDTGTGSTEQKKVANAIEATCKKRGCDFVQLLGDNIYDSGVESVDDPLWQTHFETPYAAIDLPFFVVLGNHDYGGGGAGTNFPKGKHQVDYTQKSKKWKLPAAFYHQAHPSLPAGSKDNPIVDMFGLDTNMILFGQAAAQKTDMTKWIAESTADWKIALGHHPYKSNGPHGNAGEYDAIGGVSLPPYNGETIKTFMEEVVCGKVDLYLCGHDHSRQWLNESCKGTELAVSGAGAKATELGGKNAKLFESLELGFLYVVIEGKKLTAEFIDEDVNVEFTHTITKP